MLLLSTLLPLLPLTRAYSHAAMSAFSQLATNTTSAANYINGLNGCGYASTTQAILANAAMSNGSACQAADSAVASHLTSLLSGGLQATLAALVSSRSSTDASSADAAAAFNAFSATYYVLFNALDLAECKYRLTTASQTYAVEFGGSGGGGGEPATTNLKLGYDALVAELSFQPSVAAAIGFADFKQQTHFGGTETLAGAVGGIELEALLACELITAIVTSEGGNPQ